VDLSGERDIALPDVFGALVSGEEALPAWKTGKGFVNNILKPGGARRYHIPGRLVRSTKDKNV
jgi:hypothetical protein